MEKMLMARYPIKSLIMENKINYAAMSADDIIFIDRNQAYGAYELRRTYNENIKRAILGTIFFSAFAIAFQKNLTRPKAVEEHKTIATLVDVSTIKTVEMKPPPLPKEQKLEQVKHGSATAASTRFEEMKPVASNVPLLDTVATVNPNSSISDVTQTGPNTAEPGLEKGTALETTHKAEPPKETGPLSWAEIMPEFPGGESALMSYIHNHLQYPSYENEVGIQGKAIVGFVVDENGKVTDVHVIRSVSKGIDRESMRVIGSLPVFKPGEQSGRKVKVRYVIPLDFHQTSE